MQVVEGKDQDRTPVIVASAVHKTYHTGRIKLEALRGPVTCAPGSRHPTHAVSRIVPARIL